MSQTQQLNLLLESDSTLGRLHRTYGEPPTWRRPNTLSSLVTIIIEQQVSQASARQTIAMLSAATDGLIATKLSALSDQTMHNLQVSRQKAGYIRELAQASLDGRLNLSSLEIIDDIGVRRYLTTFKGIGDWTVDIYLLMVLGRPDILPIGDVALRTAIKRVYALPAATTTEQLLLLAESWRPYRSIATRMLWHAYLSDATLRRRIS